MNPQLQQLLMMVMSNPAILQSLVAQSAPRFQTQFQPSPIPAAPIPAAPQPAAQPSAQPDWRTADYYGPESGRQQYFANMGWNTSGQEPPSTPLLPTQSSQTRSRRGFGSPFGQAMTQPQFQPQPQPSAGMAGAYGSAFDQPFDSSFGQFNAGASAGSAGQFAPMFPNQPSTRPTYRR